MTRTLLILGATGTVSTALIDVLKESDLSLRSLVRDKTPTEQLLKRGIDVVRGDLDQPRSLDSAFEGVHDVWLLTPNHPRAAENNMNAVFAARKAGVDRIVRLSAVGAAFDAPTRSGRLHALSDHEVSQSGLRWTILRPLWFMQNLLNFRQEIATSGQLRINMADGRVGMIDVRDVAAAAARILTNDTDVHDGKIYTLSGPQPLSFVEVAAALQNACGLPVRYVSASDEAMEQTLLTFGAPSWIVEMLTEYAQAYAAGWGDFVTADFERIMGYPPRSFDSYNNTLQRSKPHEDTARRTTHVDPVQSHHRLCTEPRGIRHVSRRHPRTGGRCAVGSISAVAAGQRRHAGLRNQ